MLSLFVYLQSGSQAKIATPSLQFLSREANYPSVTNSCRGKGIQNERIYFSYNIFKSARNDYPFPNTL